MRIISRKMAEEACEALGWGKETLDGEMTAEGVNAQYRAAVMEAHPDRGGSQEAFVAVDRAKHVLLAWLEKSEQAPPAHGEQCPRCEGRGYVDHQRAFRAMKVTCPRCRGTGELGVEHEKGSTQ